jgi:adenylate cyclase
VKLPSFLRGASIPTTLCLGVVAIAVMIISARIPLVFELQQRIESLAYDVRMRSTLPQDPEFDPQLVIVDIDEKSLAAEGHWPWSRALLGQLVNRITEAGASVIVFDTVFAETERNAADDIVEALGDQMEPELIDLMQQIAGMLDPEQVLAEALMQTQAVLGFTFTLQPDVASGELPASTVVYEGDLDRTSFVRMPSYVGNLDVLQQNAAGAGFFTVTPDYDQVIRRIPTVLRHGDQLYASLAIEAVRIALGAEYVEVFTKPVGEELRIDHVSIGGMIDIPTDGEGNVIVPYQGPSPRFLYVSATDVLRGAMDTGAMEGSIVLLGTTAEGLKDLRATPVQSVYPGVEVHATVISALFGAGFPTSPAWALGADVALILLIGIGATLLFPRLSPLFMLLFAIAIVSLVIWFNLWLWSRHQLVLSLATPVLMLGIVTFIQFAAGFLSEARSRRNLRDAFGQYVPASLVEQMYADPDKEFGFEGESREMSVLFSDIRGFTTISESLPPQELKQFLNEYFTPITEIIFRHQGTIDKYVGDMVMAFWGAPMRDAAHRQHAIEAALDMLRVLPRLQQEFEARGWPKVDVGIGINTGPMNVGDMGSTFRRSYTVIGDAVNLGSRLESLTKYYGVKLLVSESALAGLEGFVTRHLDRVRVKGKAEPVDIFEVCTALQEATPELLTELAAHERGMDAYFSGRWDEALDVFGALAQQYPQRSCYRLYPERIDALRQQHPDGLWDGVFEHTAK